MRWAILGESATGTSHLRNGVPCQDAFRVASFGTDGEWLIIALADGAGSASLAQIGARLACDQLVSRILSTSPVERVTSDSAIALYADVQRDLVKEASTLGVSVRELACTALLTVIGPKMALFAQLGDGAIVYQADSQLKLAFWPEPGEYANTTDFLTDENALAHLMVSEIDEPVGNVGVLTDGLQRLALNFSDQTPFGDFFGPLFEELRQSNDIDALRQPFRDFLDSDQVNKRTDDDKTLVLATRR